MAIYNNNNGTLTTLASGARVWIGTKAAFNTAKNSIPNNTAIYITDDGDGDTGWLNGTNCRARQIGKTVYVEVSNVSTVDLTYLYTTVAELPSQLRPSRNISGTFLVDNEHDIPLNSRALSTGEIIAWRNGNYSSSTESTNTIYGTFSFPID